MRIKKIALHFAFWAILYVFWIFVFQNRTLALSRTVAIEFCYLVFIALAFYFTISVLVPKFLLQKKHILFFLFSVLTLLTAAFLRAVTAHFISAYFAAAAPHPDFGILFVNSLLNITFWTEAFVAVWLIADRFRQQRYLSELEKERTANELKFLKAQNNPHFLFNSLNSIYFQIDKNNKDARETLMTFSEMLRYQLYDCSSERIPVEKEIHYLKNYIALQQLRMNDNYKVSVSGCEGLSGFSIAPLLLLPLIENAFKYISHSTEYKNEIHIVFSHLANEFSVSIRNTTGTSLKPDSERTGIGLENVKRRLDLLYPGRHQLDIRSSQNDFLVTLSVLTDEAQLYSRR